MGFMPWISEFLHQMPKMQGKIAWKACTSGNSSRTPDIKLSCISRTSATSRSSGPVMVAPTQRQPLFYALFLTVYRVDVVVLTVNGGTNDCVPLYLPSFGAGRHCHMRLLA